MSNASRSLALCAALLVVSLRGTAAESLEIRTELKPLEVMLGKWSISTLGPDGKTYNGTAEFVLDAQGQIIRHRTEVVDAAGKPVFVRVSIVHWRPDTRTIVEESFDSNGWSNSASLLQVNPDKIVWHASVITPDGKPGVNLIVLTRESSTTWTAEWKHGVVAGLVVPDSGKVTMTRK